MQIQLAIIQENLVQTNFTVILKIFFRRDQKLFYYRVKGLLPGNRGGEINWQS